jgi:hypothetical protein
VTRNGAEKADALFKIALARRNSRFSRSNSAIRPSWCPAATLGQPRRVAPNSATVRRDTKLLPDSSAHSRATPALIAGVKLQTRRPFALGNSDGSAAGHSPGLV